MLKFLRHIVQQVNAARNLDEVLSIIVRELRRGMDVDVCSVYLTDARQQRHVLMATEGLNPHSVGSVRLPAGKGLVSLVAERAEPVNLDNAPRHRRYLYFPESGEERYLSFLGAPIIHHRKVLGVLVVQRLEGAFFSEDEVTFLFTVASQLAGAITHAEKLGGIDSLHPSETGIMRRFQGLPGAQGVAVGVGAVIYPDTDLMSVPDRPVADTDKEVTAFEAAVAAVRTEVASLGARVGEVLTEEERSLFDAYLMMLGSDSMLGKTVSRIRAGNWAQGALRETIREHVQAFGGMEDPLLRERASDLRDLGRRILEHLEDRHRQGREYPEGTILVGEEISATQLAEVPPERLAGVVSMHGSQYSHTAILARAMGIPCVMGVTDMWLSQVHGRELIVDGYRGYLYVEPTPAVRGEYQRLAREEAALSEELKALRDLPAVTTDGYRVPLYANTGLLADINPCLGSGAEGIGLYRTEFPFMARDRFPGEEVQTEIYRQVLLRFAPRPVVLRTLDVGGDKALPYFPIKEANPFLGWRGIRITLDHPEIFLAQMRAMLRASEGLDNLSLLFPMISSVDELDETLGLLHQAYEELRDEDRNIPFPRLGVMVEVPASAYLIGAFSRRVDFISVGTNDLTQYLLAVDRNNERVAAQYDNLHPAVVQMLARIVEDAKHYGLPVSVCGEMAGDPVAVLLLLGMGVDSLSTSAANLPRVKWVIRKCSRARAQVLLSQCLHFEQADAVRRYLRKALEEAGLGGLVRAGRW
jgi:phosphotransferase system enzyme I (PtsP)